MCLLPFCLQAAFGQWTKINSIPSTDIVAFTTNNGTIYAASASNKIYKSSDGGIIWDAIQVSSDTINISTIITFNNKIFVGTYTFGVYASTDDGNTWQHDSQGPAQISDFAIKNNKLYASTLGDGVEVMNAATNTWSFVNNGIPSYSANVQRIISSPAFLLIAAGANGTYYRFNFISNSWQEEFYDGGLNPGLQINNFINRGDTLFAVNFNRIIRSNNAGGSWTNDDNGTRNGYYRSITEGQNNYYTITDVIPSGGFPLGTWIQTRNKTAAIGTGWAANEEFLPGVLAYEIIEFNNKLFLAKGDGLYFKDLIPAPVPIHFTLFNVKCEADRVDVSWKTAQEQNSSRFDLEKSTDAVHWTIVNSSAAAGNSNTEKNYSFVDNNPVRDSYYRIAEYDLDGKVQYTGVLRSSCSVTDNFTLWPNPVHDNLYINIGSANKSPVVISVFDSKGALVKLQKETVLQGSNQFRINTSSLPKGTYLLSAEWNNGQNKKTTQLIKQ